MAAADTDRLLAVALEQIKNLASANERHEKLLKELQDERTKFLTWGIVAIGGALVGLAGWTFNFVKDHLK